MIHLHSKLVEVKHFFQEAVYDPNRLLFTDGQQVLSASYNGKEYHFTNFNTEVNRLLNQIIKGVRNV